MSRLVERFNGEETPHLGIDNLQSGNHLMLVDEAPEANRCTDLRWQYIDYSASQWRLHCGKYIVI